MNDDQRDDNLPQNPAEPVEMADQPLIVDTAETDEATEHAETAQEQPSEQEPDGDEPIDAEPAEDDEGTQEGQEGDEELEEDPGSLVHWTAHEYIHTEKNGLWYVIFILVVIGLIALDVFILKSYTFSALVIVMAVALTIYTRRPPRTMQYTLSENHGLYIGERLYSFEEFKAFGLLKDGEHHSIMLIPIKRFAPGVSVYFPEESGEEIVDILGSRLPMQELKLDFIDTTIRRLRL